MFEEDAYEKLCYSAYVIKDGNINWFPAESPARLWNYVYKKFGMREGTLMALCNAIDTTCYIPESLMQKWSSYKFFDEEARHNSQEVVESISEYIYGISKDRIGIDCSEFDSRFSNDENRLSMIGKVINQLSLDMVFRNIDFAIEKYNLDSEKITLALSGGFALNCPTNTACLEKYNFCSYQIPPCASDTGIAMGIGIPAFLPLLKDKKITLDISSAYYGQNVGDVEKAVEKFSPYIEKARQCSIEEFVKYIIDGEVLVWVNGNAEIGPRALGNRSLIADARFNKSKDILNIVKKRQWWRPVAPLILDECGPDYFENYHTSPNMLVNLSVKNAKKDKIKAVVHFDGSARIQSVSEKDNPVLYNTSLNDAGEPIINKINEAIEFALHKGLKFVCVNGNYLIRLKESKEQLNKCASLRNCKFFFKPEDFDAQSYLKKLNPHNLTLTQLTLYYDHPKEFSGLSLNSEECANKVRAYTEKFLKKYKHVMKR